MSIFLAISFKDFLFLSGELSTFVYQKEFHQIFLLEHNHIGQISHRLIFILILTTLHLHDPNLRNEDIPNNKDLSGLGGREL